MKTFKTIFSPQEFINETNKNEFINETRRKIHCKDLQICEHATCVLFKSSKSHRLCRAYNPLGSTTNFCLALAIMVMFNHHDHLNIKLSTLFSFRRQWIEMSQLKSLYLLAFCTNPSDDDSWCRSLSTQHDHIIPPEHESTGFPPAKTHDMLNPHSKRLPLYLHVCGITEGARTATKNQKFQMKKKHKT